MAGVTGGHDTTAYRHRQAARVCVSGIPQLRSGFSSSYYSGHCFVSIRAVCRRYAGHRHSISPASRAAYQFIRFRQVNGYFPAAHANSIMFYSHRRHRSGFPRCATIAGYSITGFFFCNRPHIPPPPLAFRRLSLIPPGLPRLAFSSHIAFVSAFAPLDFVCRLISINSLPIRAFRHCPQH